MNIKKITIKLISFICLLFISYSCSDNSNTIEELIYEGDIVIDTDEKYEAFIQKGYTEVNGNLTL